MTDWMKWRDGTKFEARSLQAPPDRLFKTFSYQNNQTLKRRSSRDPNEGITRLAFVEEKFERI